MACDTLGKYSEAADVIRALWKVGSPLDQRIYTKAFKVLANGEHTEVSKIARDK